MPEIREIKEIPSKVKEIKEEESEENSLEQEIYEEEISKLAETLSASPASAVPLESDPIISEEQISSLPQQTPISEEDIHIRAYEGSVEAPVESLEYVRRYTSAELQEFQNLRDEQGELDLTASSHAQGNFRTLSNNAIDRSRLGEGRELQQERSYEVDNKKDKRYAWDR